MGDWGDSPYSLLRYSPIPIKRYNRLMKPQSVFPQMKETAVIEFKDMFIVQHGFIKSSFRAVLL